MSTRVVLLGLLLIFARTAAADEPPGVPTTRITDARFLPQPPPPPTTAAATTTAGVLESTPVEHPF